MANDVLYEDFGYPCSCADLLTSVLLPLNGSTQKRIFGTFQHNYGEQ